MNDIQVTDLDHPAKNKLQIGKIHWRMLWDALLRGKVAIDDASMLEIQLGVPRKRPGRVLPPDPPSESQFDKLKQKALAAAQEEFSKNVLGDAAAILAGTDPTEQLKHIEAELKSSARIKSLQEELKVKEVEWRGRLERLPQAKDIQALADRAKKIKTSNFNNPAEIQQSLQELDSVFKDADAKYKEVTSTAQALGADTTKYRDALKELEDMVKQDIKDLEARLKLPKLDVATLSRTLFGPLFLDKVKKAEFYMDKARSYMPPKKTAEEKAEYAAPKPHEREKGRNYKFGRPHAYPLFWMKHASISSKANPKAELAGDLVGTLRDVTDDPPTLGRPTIASFKGDFPTQKIFGVAGDLTIDHTTTNPVESLKLKVGRFPVTGQTLVDSDEVKMGFENADGGTTLEAVLRGKELKIDTHSEFSGIKYLVEAKQQIVGEILRGAVADVPKVTLNASASGSWTDLRFDIDSNLGHELAKAFEKQLQLKINEARAKVQALIDERIGQEKAKLQAEFNKVQDQVNKIVQEKQGELDKAKNQIEQEKNKAINDQKSKLQNEGQKAIDELKKKFKF
jgi:uncharacterized protein (TIGR03545 family)